jgi:hypothetical protein
LSGPSDNSRNAAPNLREPDEGAARSSLQYEILIPRRPIRDRKLTRPGGKQRPCQKEAVMLDVAFVALGIVVLALMGLYALALRQL